MTPAAGTADGDPTGSETQHQDRASGADAGVTPAEIA
jgi:hypothetical protein